ncbi:MAG: helix-turn-helix domain-containing protein [Candidatus Binataceae bacterium]
MKNVTMKPLFLRVPQAAELLQISRAKAYALAASGDLPSVRIGKGSIRIPMEAIEKLAAVKGGAEDGLTE